VCIGLHNSQSYIRPTLFLLFIFKLAVD